MWLCLARVRNGNPRPRYGGIRMMLHLMQTLLTITLISVIVFFVSETVRNLEREEVKLLRDIRNTLHSILGLLKPVPFYARLTVMPKSIEVGQTATAALQV